MTEIQKKLFETIIKGYCECNVYKCNIQSIFNMPGSNSTLIERDVILTEIIDLIEDFFSSSRIELSPFVFTKPLNEPEKKLYNKQISIGKALQKTPYGGGVDFKHESIGLINTFEFKMPRDLIKVNKISSDLSKIKHLEEIKENVKIGIKELSNQTEIE